jgi:hypothetical protein
LNDAHKRLKCYGLSERQTRARHSIKLLVLNSHSQIHTFDIHLAFDLKLIEMHLTLFDDLFHVPVFMNQQKNFRGMKKIIL